MPASVLPVLATRFWPQPSQSFVPELCGFSAVFSARAGTALQRPRQFTAAALQGRCAYKCARVCREGFHSTETPFNAVFSKEAETVLTYQSLLFKRLLMQQMQWA